MSIYLYLSLLKMKSAPPNGLVFVFAAWRRGGSARQRRRRRRAAGVCALFSRRATPRFWPARSRARQGVRWRGGGEGRGGLHVRDFFRISRAQRHAGDFAPRAIAARARRRACSHIAPYAARRLYLLAPSAVHRACPYVAAIFLSEPAGRRYLHHRYRAPSTALPISRAPCTQAHFIGRICPSSSSISKTTRRRAAARPHSISMRRAPAVEQNQLTYYQHAVKYLPPSSSSASRSRAEQ